MDNQITRRDFLNGIALPVAGGALSLSPLAAMAKQGIPASDSSDSHYPPALTGMRGSHPGSFEVAHGLALGGAKWAKPQRRTDDEYDLVVVGGGLSGLAAAWYFRERAGGGAKILVLDNHDDFGGHAKRNEFDVDGRTLIGYGGSQSIDSPADYSRPAKRLLRALAVDPERFYGYFDEDFFARFGLNSGVYFPPSAFAPTGTAKVLLDVLNPFQVGATTLAEQEQAIRRYPLSEQSKIALVELVRGDLSFMPKTSVRVRSAALREMPAEAFFKNVVGLADDGVTAFADAPRLLMGYSADVMSAWELLEYGLLGERGGALLYTGRAKVSKAFAKELAEESEPYIFHFPDGNATIARLLARSLVPGAAPGRSMEDIVQARFDYGKLDAAANQTKIRLNSTVVNVEHVPGNAAVDLTYVRQGAAERVRGKHAILACYNKMIPHICPEVGQDQAAVEALNYAEKTPLTYVNIALRNWRALARSGFARVYAPESFLTVLSMDFPVSMGGYGFTAAPEQPALLQGFHVSSLKAPGMNPREQARLGRRLLLNTSFADFEREIREHLDAFWGGAGLDVNRDIAAITVNRWPHGYAYEYLDLWDPDWDRGAAPHLVGRRQRGRISIANSDSEALAYVNGAIDAAHRAVREQLGAGATAKA